MIVVEAVHAKGSGRPRPILANASLRWEKGLFSVLGAPIDGTSLLFSCLAGQTRTKRGSISIGGRPAEQGRLDVFHVPLDPILPESLRVREVIALASEIRREPAASLALLGIESLAERRVSALSPSEARAVLLSIALGSRATTLLVEEPLSKMEGARHVAELLRDRSAVSSVLVATSSVRDAVTLGGSLAVMTKGFLSPVQGALRHELRVVSRSAEALAAAIGDDDAIESVSLPNAMTLTLVGADLDAIAAAVNRAASNARILVDLVEPAVASLEELRAHVAAAVAKAGAPA